MLLSGFTFLRNADILGYPFAQSIKSILPLVDEFVVLVGKSNDNTLEIVKNIKSNKIRIIQSTWNENMQSKGFVYAQQKMIAQYSCTSKWAFYIEADEIVHENDLDKIATTLSRVDGESSVEALLFDYIHFYGSPEYIAISPAWYRRECRIIRNTIRSYAPDGQYWLITEAHKKPRFPRAIDSGAKMYHYGHIRKLERMQEKMNQVSKYWSHAAPIANYKNIDPQSLRRFQGTHPQIAADWIQEQAELDYTPNLTYSPTKREIKHRAAMVLEKIFKVDLSKKHYSKVVFRD